MSKSYKEGYAPSRRVGQEQQSLFKRNLKPDIDRKTGQARPLRPNDLDGKVFDFKDGERVLDHTQWKLKRLRGFRRQSHKKIGCPNCSYPLAWTHPNSEKAWCYRCAHKFDY